MTRLEGEEGRVTVRARERERAEIIQSGKLKDREKTKKTLTSPSKFYMQREHVLKTNVCSNNTEETSRRPKGKQILSSFMTFLLG